MFDKKATLGRMWVVLVCIKTFDLLYHIEIFLNVQIKLHTCMFSSKSLIISNSVYSLRLIYNILFGISGRGVITNATTTGYCIFIQVHGVRELAEAVNLH